MTVQNLAEAKKIQRWAVDKLRHVIRQHAVSSLQIHDDGQWILQLRFPLSISREEKKFLKSLEAETGMPIIIEDNVGQIRHLVR